MLLLPEGQTGTVQKNALWEIEEHVIENFFRSFYKSVFDVYFTNPTEYVMKL
jgi:hypothetical protein